MLSQGRSPRKRNMEVWTLEYVIFTFWGLKIDNRTAFGFCLADVFTSGSILVHVLKEICLWTAAACFFTGQMLFVLHDQVLKL